MNRWETVGLLGPMTDLILVRRRDGDRAHGWIRQILGRNSRVAPGVVDPAGQIRAVHTADYLIGDIVIGNNVIGDSGNYVSRVYLEAKQ